MLHKEVFSYKGLLRYLKNANVLSIRQQLPPNMLNIQYLFRVFETSKTMPYYVSFFFVIFSFSATRSLKTTLVAKKLNLRETMAKESRVFHLMPLLLLFCLMNESKQDNVYNEYEPKPYPKSPYGFSCFLQNYLYFKLH